MQLVILAAGHGRRFGGLKQLAPVGPSGEALMDFTVRAAEASGFEGAVLVVREDIRAEIAAHVTRAWPKSLPVEFVVQGPTPGTAQAVASTRPVIDGPFGVANADDFYGRAAIETLYDHFVGPFVSPMDLTTNPAAHLVVAYRLRNTVLSAASVNRALCDIATDSTLVAIDEHTVSLRGDGTFDAATVSEFARSDGGVWTKRLSGNEEVSMNLWGFHRRILDELDAALDVFDPSSAPRPELLLPDVVGSLIRARSDAVHVEATEARCVGVTYPEDVTAARREVMEESLREATSLASTG